MKLTAIYEKVPGGYLAFLEEWCGTNAQGATLDEARENLRDAVELLVDLNRLASQKRLQGKTVIREPF